MAKTKDIRPITKQVLRDALMYRNVTGVPVVELRCERYLDDQADLRGCLQGDGQFTVFDRADYEAYVHRSIFYPNAEEKLIGTNRFWSNNLDVNGG
jgi:hypothetical protein